ncbi:DUF177 domain-containing protein [bacterium SCSIO 12741]|nr:DUF177 domain-containing protein [bacterium SCSIO 12741]
MSQLLYEFIHLALPLKNVHNEGECDPEMVKKIEELNYGEGEEEESTDPRWNALKSLKRK